MQTNFPPKQEAQVTLANWRRAPYSKWAFHHVNEIVPSSVIKHDPAAVSGFAVGDQSIDNLELAKMSIPGNRNNIESFLKSTDTDGLVVLKDGKLVFEAYPSIMSADDPHILMSVSKSMLGLLAGILANEGVLDVESQVTSYIPELIDSGFAGATVRDLLDMRCGVAFDEDYLATTGKIIEYRKATNWNPLSEGEQPGDLRSFFLTLNERSGPHGGVFDYKSPCTDLLGWVIERATGSPYSRVFSEKLWSRVGAEFPAMITVDRLGAPRVAGGISMTTRDLARVGQLIADGGRGIIPESWIVDIETGGDPEAWSAGSLADHFVDRSMHYRSKWYVLRDEGPVLLCLGIHGQNLLIDRQANLVLAKQACANDALDGNSTDMTIALFEELRDAL